MNRMHRIFFKNEGIGFPLVVEAEGHPGVSRSTKALLKPALFSTPEPGTE
jgi:hypothetical protein